MSDAGEPRPPDAPEALAAPDLTSIANREVELRRQLVELESERNSQDQLNRDRLVRVTNQLIGTLTAPEFVENMRKARGLSDRGEGFDDAAELLSVDALRRAGVDLPEDFRMTSRVFEDKVTGIRLEFKDDLITRDPGTLQWGACGGGGGLTFCGCAGGST